MPESGVPAADFDAGAHGPGIDAAPHYVLQLLIAGTTPRSARAIVNVRQICETHLRGRYELEVIDITQNPAAAVLHQIVAAPTLIKLMLLLMA